MKSDKLNLLIAIFMIFSLIVSIGAEGNITNSNEEFSIEKVDQKTIETETNTEETTNHISEENLIEVERIESLPPEEKATSENLGANSGQNEEAPISSQEEVNEDSEKNIDYIPLEEVLGETSSSPIPEENNETNQFSKTEQKDEEILSNESQNQEEVGSGQEQEVKVSPGQNEVMNENDKNETSTNKTKTNPSQINGEEDYADVRGNTQEDTGSSGHSSSSDSGPVSLSSSESSDSTGEKTIEYVDLSKINENYEKNKNNTNTNSTNSTNNTTNKNKNQEEKQLYSYYSNGKKVIEIETTKEVEISKEEIIENEFKKKVIVSSEEDVQNPLRVFIDLEKEVLISKIKIFWENENLDITNLEEFSVKYYDENDNGLVDRISWIVPHLSEQIFEIVIENKYSKNDTPNSIFLNVNGPSGRTENPISFGINISSNFSNVNCSLKIDKETTTVLLRYFEQSGTNNFKNINLENGNYTWKVNCSNGSMSNSTTENFSIQEGFSLSSPEKVYLLDDSGYLVGSADTIDINSEQISNISIIVDRPDPYANHESNFYGTQGSLVLDESVITGEGYYEIIVNFKEPSANEIIEKNFSVAKISFALDESPIEMGEEKDFRIIVKSEVEKIQSLIFDLGPGENNNITFWDISTNNFDQTFSHTYNQEGSYLVTISLKINGEMYNLNVQTVEVVDSGDTSPPDITLIYPEDDEIIHEENMTFKYEAKDNVEIDNCTFKLYNVSKGSTIHEGDEFTNVRQINKSLENNERVEIKIVWFETGGYAWEVECFDNSSNGGWKIYLFDVVLENSTNSTLTTQFNDYEQREYIEDVLGGVNAFLLDEEEFEADVKEVLNDLGISKDIEFYKKRLIQIDQYFKENYKYVSSEELREQKEKEYLEEFENIKNKIPKEIEIIDSFEYVKNSVEIDLE
jgi:hypothetical protein